MKRLIGPIVVFILLSGILYAIVRFIPIRPLLPDLQVGVQQGTEMTVEHLYADTDTYHVDAQYPQFAVPSDVSAKGGLVSINSQIKSAMENAVAEFEALPPNPSDSAMPQNQFTGTFDNVYVGPDIVSVKLVFSQYTGGAHNLTLLSGMNFERATGRLLLLDDVLPLIGKTVQQVSLEASAQFAQKFGDGFFSEGATDNPENFSSFTISADKVTFIFQQYQVAAYAAGPQEISFPRK